MSTGRPAGSALRRFLPLALAVFAVLLLALLVQRALSPGPAPSQAPAPPPAAEAPAPLEIVFFDVGQGDATLIRAPQGQLVLIDGGRSRGQLSALLQELGVERLDLVIASHADLDHIGGLAEAVERFRPRFFMDNGVPHSTQAYLRLLEAVEASDAVYLEAEARQLELGDAALHVLPPPRFNQDQNQNSVGVVLVYGDFRAVFPGDVPTRTQGWWLENFGETLANTRLYKAAHHGSSSGDAPDFLRALGPEVVVVSAGEDNPYGHPAPEVLASYAGVGARVYRTDRDGHVTVVADPAGRLEVSTAALPELAAPAALPPGAALPELQLAPGLELDLGLGTGGLGTGGLGSGRDSAGEAGAP